MIHTPRTCSTHGGVAIYLQENFEYKNLFINGNTEIWDGLFIEITINNENGQKLVVGNIYRPPRDNVENYETFSKEMEEILSSKLCSYKEVVICGDFNIDLLKCQDSVHINNFLEVMIAGSYLPKITLPTRVTSHSGTLIDNCFVKLSSRYSKTTAGIINYDISDHLPYFVTLDFLSLTKHLSKYVKIYKNTPAAKQNFKDDINSKLSNFQYDRDLNNDPNVIYDQLHTTI